MLLARAYWEGGAHPLPTDDTTLMLLAGLHGRQWSEQRDRVLTAWREIEPKLAAVYAHELKIHEGRLYIARCATEGRRKARLSSKPKMNTEARLEAGSNRLMQSGARLVPQRESLRKDTLSIEGAIIPKRVSRGSDVKFRDSTPA